MGELIRGPTTFFILSENIAGVNIDLKVLIWKQKCTVSSALQKKTQAKSSEVKESSYHRFGADYHLHAIFLAKAKTLT